MTFTELICCFKNATHPKQPLNDFGELRIWRITCNMERPKTRPLVPFEGTGCDGVPSTASDPDFGFAQHAHDVEKCISEKIRFPDRLTSRYGCSDQFAPNWGIPCLIGSICSSI